MKNIEKLLIVTCDSSTQIFIALFKPDQMCVVKGLLEKMLTHFDDHVLLHALESVHMMNRKDESTVQAWMMVGEFEEAQTCTPVPSHKNDLQLLHGAVVK